MMVVRGVASEKVRRVARMAGWGLFIVRGSHFVLGIGFFFSCGEGGSMCMRVCAYVFIHILGAINWDEGEGGIKTYNDLLPHDPQFPSLLHPRFRSRFRFNAQDAGFRDGQAEDAVEDLEACDWEQEFAEGGHRVGGQGGEREVEEAEEEDGVDVVVEAGGRGGEEGDGGGGGDPCSGRRVLGRGGGGGGGRGDCCCGGHGGRMGLMS